MAHKRISELSSIEGKLAAEDLFLVQDIAPISESKSVSWGYLSSIIAASASVESSSYSITSSFAQQINSASWASSSISSSYALAASGSGIYAWTSSYAFTASFAHSASFASGSGVFANSSSYALTSSYSHQASSSISASYSISASFASGSGVFANSSSYAFSASHALTSSNSLYAPNGIETGYMILYAGLETSTIEDSGQFLVCNGRDLFVKDYQNLYNVIGEKFGYYPELRISASRGIVAQPIYVYIDHEDVNFYGNALGHGDVIFTAGVGAQSFGSTPNFGVYTITSIKAGNTGSTQVLSSNSPVSFVGLGAATYNFIITEINIQSSSMFPVKINLQGTNTAVTFSAGTLPFISFTGNSNVAYDSKFRVTDLATDQTSEGILKQTAAGSIVTQVSAVLRLRNNANFTCSISRHSGSYHNIHTARLKKSTNTLTFMGTNNDSFVPIMGTLSSSFFIPSVNNSTGSVPANMSPSNAQITQSGAYKYAFRYLIKT